MLEALPSDDRPMLRRTTTVAPISATSAPDHRGPAVAAVSGTSEAATSDADDDAPAAASEVPAAPAAIPPHAPRPPIATATTAAPGAPGHQRSGAPARPSGAAHRSAEAVAAPPRSPPALWASLGFMASDEPDDLADPSSAPAPTGAETAPAEAAPAALSSLIDVDLTGAGLAATRVRSALARNRK